MGWRCSNNRKILWTKLPGQSLQGCLRGSQSCRTNPHHLRTVSSVYELERPVGGGRFCQSSRCSHATDNASSARSVATVGFPLPGDLDSVDAISVDQIRLHGVSKVQRSAYPWVPRRETESVAGPEDGCPSTLNATAHASRSASSPAGIGAHSSLSRRSVAIRSLCPASRTQANLLLRGRRRSCSSVAACRWLRGSAS